MIALRHDQPRLERVTASRIASRLRSLGVREKHAFAAVAVERLDDHLAALFVHETLEPRNFVGHERGRNRVGKIQRVELFVGLAQAGRIVEHEGLPASARLSSIVA